MTWWMWALLAWSVLSVPVAVGVGRFLRGPRGAPEHRAGLPHVNDAAEPRAGLPTQRRGEESA
jgi:hypothetical protein